MDTKREVTLRLDPALVLALDGLAAEQGANRSQALEGLQGLALQAQEAQRTAEKKVSLTIRVTPAVSERIKAIAKVSSESANQTAANLLEAGIRTTLDDQQKSAIEQLRDELREIVEASRKAAEQHAHRQAHLLSRAVLENLHNRHLLAALLAQQGLTADQVRTLSDTAFSRALEQLKNPTPTLKAALSDLLPVRQDV